MPTWYIPPSLSNICYHFWVLNVIEGVLIFYNYSDYTLAFIHVHHASPCKVVDGWPSLNEQHSNQDTQANIESNYHGALKWWFFFEKKVLRGVTLISWHGY
jgi:hypothetical protein